MSYLEVSTSKKSSAAEKLWNPDNERRFLLCKYCVSLLQYRVNLLHYYHVGQFEMFSCFKLCVLIRNVAKCSFLVQMKISKQMIYHTLQIFKHGMKNNENILSMCTDKNYSKSFAVKHVLILVHKTFVSFFSFLQLEPWLNDLRRLLHQSKTICASSQCKWAV